MKTITKTLLIATSILASFSAAAVPDLEANAYDMYPSGYGIDIYNLGEAITVTKATVNRGRCDADRLLTKREKIIRWQTGARDWPVTIEEGGVLQIGSEKRGCPIRYLELVLDDGQELEFTWQ